MIVLFGGEKGGTGKSTLATNLAVYLVRAGKDVLLLDTDVQRSASGWVAIRSQEKDLPPVQCVEKLGDVLTSAKDLAKRYEHIVIDAGGRDSPELRSAMLAAHKLYIPVRASQFDLWTMSRMHKLVEQSQAFNRELKVWAILSMAPTNPAIHEAEEAQEMLKDFERIKLSEAIVRERKVYRDAVIAGKGVLELDNDKATDEIEAMAKEICDGKI